MNHEKKITILSVFGTRPEAIKMGPVLQEFNRHKEIKSIVCVTGQHREMLDQVLNVFRITPQYDLNIMHKEQSLAEITELVLRGMDDIIKREDPDIIIVHGDTTTSFAAGLSAFYNKVPVGHIEAGLRTYEMSSPFPEEFNREAVDLFTDMYFAPTQKTAENLIREGKNPDKIFITGNTVIDALRVTTNIDYWDDNLQWASDSRMIVLTAHRRENIGRPLVNIYNAVKQIIYEFPDVKFIYPVHKNPQIRKIANKILGNISRIRLIEPLDVIAFHNYIKNCYLVMSDSGGVQEEAPAMGKPVLVLRNNTERPEGIEAGTLKLVGTDISQIIHEVSTLLNDKQAYEFMAKAMNPYGDGHASERITKEIINKFR